MRKLLILTCLALLCSTSAFAQGATKAGASSSNLINFHFNTGGPVTTPWVNAISVDIKNPGPQGLFVTFNCQTITFALSSQTTLPIPAFFFAITTEAVGIQARLLVDGAVVPYATGPGALVLNVVNVDNQARQTVTANFPPNGPELLQLVTQHGGNRSVTWIVPDTSNGDHTVTVQVRFTSSTFNIPIPTTFDAVQALVGARNLTVESVHLK